MPPEESSHGVEWNKVTWYSKLGAIVLFIAVVPILTFYIGMQYQSVLGINASIPAPQSIPIVDTTPHSTTTSPVIFAKECDKCGDLSYTGIDFDNPKKYVINPDPQLIQNKPQPFLTTEFYADITAIPSNDGACEVPSPARSAYLKNAIDTNTPPQFFMIVPAREMKVLVRVKTCYGIVEDTDPAKWVTILADGFWKDGQTQKITQTHVAFTFPTSRTVGDVQNQMAGALINGSWSGPEQQYLNDFKSMMSTVVFII